MTRIFLCNGNYRLLETSGVLTTKTATEAQLFCQQNKGVTIVFFQQGTEAAPAFFSNSDARVKKINIAFDALGSLMGSYDRELNGVFDLVMAWVASTTLIEIKHIAAMVKERRG